MKTFNISQRKQSSPRHTGLFTTYAGHTGQEAVLSLRTRSTWGPATPEATPSEPTMPHEHIEPVENALAALCNCITWAIQTSTAQRNEPIEGLEVQAMAEVDPQALCADAKSGANGFLKDLALRIHVEGRISDEARDEVFALVERSPVRALFGQPIRTMLCAA